jgi:hypothetical protein
MKNSMIQKLAALALVATVALLTGCASPASKENMEAPALATAKQYPYSVSVTTRGGSETDAAGSSNVSDADLKAAIEASISKSKLFKTIVPGKGGDYELNVGVTEMKKPLFGGSFTVEMEAAWSLTKVSDKSVVLRKSVRSSHTATMSDAFVGVKRLQLAVEGAVRNNISQGLTALSEQGF